MEVVPAVPAVKRPILSLLVEAIAVPPPPPPPPLEVLDDVVPDIDVVAAVANEAAVAAEADVNVGVALIVDVEDCMAEVVVLLLPPPVVFTVIRLWIFL